MSFTDNFKISYLAAGTTEGTLAGAMSSTGNPVDMNGYDGVIFIVPVNKVVTTTSGVNVIAYGACSSGATFHSIAGSAVQCGSSDTKFLITCEVVKPQPEHRWMQASAVVPATCTWLGGIIAIQYGPRYAPVTLNTCNYEKVVISATSG